jgi:formiminotetrahydrofolate cyclodeaminase
MTTQQLYDELMDGYLLQTREQIQQDLLTLIDSDDEALNDKICQIVVDNFAKFFSECANP